MHGKTIGWHTFRRSLATLLQAKQVDIKVTQELLRHANSRVTMDLYVQGDADAKRVALDHTLALVS